MVEVVRDWKPILEYFSGVPGLEEIAELCARLDSELRGLEVVASLFSYHPYSVALSALAELKFKKVIEAIQRIGFLYSWAVSEVPDREFLELLDLIEECFDNMQYLKLTDLLDRLLEKLFNDFRLSKQMISLAPEVS